MTMALKPNQITRRNFVQRAGLLVTSLGVAGGVQSGLMDAILRKANSKWGVGEAFGATKAASGAVKYVVELTFRAGFQFNSIFPSAGHKFDARNQALNIYSSQGMIQPYTAPGRPNNPAFIATYNFGGAVPEGGQALLNAINTINNGAERIGLATTECVRLQTGQHTGSFSARSPNTNAPAPVILHGSKLANPAAVNTVNWNNGVSVTNVTPGGYNAAARVADRTQFQALFRDLPMYFTFEELKLIIGSIDKGQMLAPGAIDSLDNLFAVKSVPGTNEIKQVSLGGRGQAQLSLLSALDATYNGNLARFTAPQMALGGAQLGVALNSALAGFANGAVTSVNVSMDSGDWHGDINALDSATDKQGQWNRFVGNALAGFLTAAANTMDPEGTPIIDSLLIAGSSEFTRTPNRNGGGTGGDNGDGGRYGGFLIGSQVKTGSIGNIRGSGAVEGFDYQTGVHVPGSAANTTEAEWWKTTGKALGAPDSSLAMVGGMAIPAIFKL
jgi:hypothetical protein